MLASRMRLKRRLTCTFLTAATAGLLVAPAFAAKKLHWNETYKNSAGRVLNFQVTSLSVTQSTWTAHVSFQNLSKKTVKVGNQFAIAFFATAKTEDPAKASSLVQATTFSPARPTVLGPGASWSGVISGTGQLSTKTTSGFVRILFGPFLDVPGQKGTTYWITDHETSVPATSVASSGGGLVA